MEYITALTALNIPMPGRIAPDWHSQVLTDAKFWSWSGLTLSTTDHLLGDADVYDATKILQRYKADTPDGTLAASYERAVFDLLYHFSLIGKPVPNIQWKDIDHEVDADQVKRWIDAADLPESQKTTMLEWFKCCD